MTNKIWMAIALGISIILLFVSIYLVSISPAKNYCSEESRNAESCILIYSPVCGWFNESINCISYPCANTYGNSCQACMDNSVEYWTEGECPR